MYIIEGGLNHPQTVGLNMERSDQSIFWVFGFQRLIDLVVPQASWFLRPCWPYFDVHLARALNMTELSRDRKLP